MGERGKESLRGSSAGTKEEVFPLVLDNFSANARRDVRRLMLLKPCSTCPPANLDVNNALKMLISLKFFRLLPFSSGKMEATAANSHQFTAAPTLRLWINIRESARTEKNAKYSA